MAIVKWHPWRELDSMRQSMDSVFDRFSGVQRDTTWGSGTWQPAVDLVENDNEFVLTAELPGLEKKDISLNIVNNVVTLKGEKNISKEVKEDKYYRLERSSGSFQRSFSLPKGVQTARVSAEFKEGILKVVLPKMEEVKPKAIPIAVK
ncbi:Hsp20/alpha crystallin family protein [candidate division KSB1 bacterium]|nr:Hsp20/alpha crystallin family protein [candidate division KSB1 bacterium]